MDKRAADEPAGGTLEVPKPAHLPREWAESPLPDDTTDSDSELEATELHRLNDNPTVVGLSHILSPGDPMLHWYDPIKRLWRHQIRISVPHADCRDHLANERTFLGYLRTSVTLAILSVMIAQLWMLEHSVDPSKTFGYYLLSKPLAVIFQGAAICVILAGSIRFLRQQNAMAIGRVHGGGWEINFVGGACFTVGEAACDRV